MSGRFEILGTPLADLKVLQRVRVGDSRGFFERLYCSTELQPVLAGRGIVQINRTLTVVRGTVRGLHFQQPPHAEMKFVTCLRGKVFDVAVDLRRHSKTFLHWHAEELSGSNHRTFVIPEGFAHGFQALSDDCEMLYLHTSEYVAKFEGGVNARDPRLAIAWPEPIGERSTRDTSHPMIDADFSGINL